MSSSRLAMHVRFRMPEIEERREIWKAMLPSRAPVSADINFGDLAKLRRRLND